MRGRGRERTKGEGVRQLDRQAISQPYKFLIKLQITLEVCRGY